MFEDLAKAIWQQTIGPISSPLYQAAANAKYEYDFHDNTNNLRIEVKSSSICKHQTGFTFHFRSVNLTKFDRLLLVFYFPDRIEMFIWNGKSGLCRSGKNIKVQCHDVMIRARNDGKAFVVVNNPGKQIFSRYFFE